MNFLLDFLFPRRCVGCGRIGRYICNICRKTLILSETRCAECDRPAIDGLTHPICRRPWGIDGLTTVFRYEKVVKRAIKQLKYRFVSDEAETLISLIPRQIFAAIPLDDNWVISPIPLHDDRLKWRGFNQAEKLGHFLGARLKLPVVDGLMVRHKKRFPQADIEKREERIKNAEGLFTISSKFQISKQLNILLVDDVWTTGATMKAAVKVLKKAGVKGVWGMTLAR